MLSKIFKISFLLSILMIFGCNSSDEQNERQPISCLSTDLQNGVVAFYPFDNGSINDESGNDYHLTNLTTASATMDRNGNLNCAYNFVQANGDFLEYINPMFLDDLPENGYSVSFWYKIDGTRGFANFINRGEGQICIWTTGQWSIKYTDDVIQFGVNGAVAIPTDIVDLINWEHLVVTAIGTDLKIYRNGILSADEIPWYICDATNPTLNQGDLFIGQYLDGQLDDILIYNRVLNSSEITELFNLTACCN